MSLHYAQISEDLIDHPKTTRAIRALRVNRLQFVGHLACLWNWAIKLAPDGDLSRFSNRDIADAARWTDPDDWEEEAEQAAQRFVQVLLECRTTAEGAGFLEHDAQGRLLIHDWIEYGGKLDQTRERNAFRQWQHRWKEKGIHAADTPENWERYRRKEAPVEACVPLRKAPGNTSPLRNADVAPTP